MGGDLMQALGTVIIGMGTVFAVLILICLIIYCFNLIPYLEEKRANRAKKQEPPVVVAPQPEVIRNVTTGITPEEVAAIAAAIEAYTGLSQSEFIVRKIVRR